MHTFGGGVQPPAAKKNNTAGQSGGIRIRRIEVTLRSPLPLLPTESAPPPPAAPLSRPMDGAGRHVL